MWLFGMLKEAGPFHGVSAFQNLLVPKRGKEVAEMLALKGSHGWHIRHLSRNQSTRVGQVLGEQGLLMSYYIYWGA